MIEVTNLTKNYDAFKAVDSINFSITQGEVVGLLGPNGAGKTTTIRMLTSYLEPTSGVVKIDGVNVLDNTRAVKQKIGYLPESAPLYEDMIVYSYLKYVAKVRKIASTAEGIDRRIDEIVATCGLEAVMHKSVGELSKGYRQRVGLAHALIGDTEILILDEPTSGLDPNQIVEIRSLIKKIGKEKTVILSSHILSEVEATCDRVIIISNGKVVADGVTNDLNNTIGGDILMLGFKGTKTSLKDVKAALGSIKDVIKVKETNIDSVQEFQVVCQKGVDVRDKIYAQIKATKLSLIAMYKPKNTLENIFRELTH